MFPTIFSLALRDAGTKTKLASSLLIMTIVGRAIATVIMGYIADTTGSIAIAFLIPLVCYGGAWRVCTFDLLCFFFGKEVVFSPLSSLTLKGGSTFLTKPLFPQGRENVTALRCSEPLHSKVGGASKPSPSCAGCDRLGCYVSLIKKM